MAATIREETIGVCNSCDHHRMDHDEQEYPKITFCYLCNCNEFDGR